eukprot:gene3571-biopygen17238
MVNRTTGFPGFSRTHTTKVGGGHPPTHPPPLGRPGWPVRLGRVRRPGRSGGPGPTSPHNAAQQAPQQEIGNGWHSTLGLVPHVMQNCWPRPRVFYHFSRDCLARYFTGGHPEPGETPHLTYFVSRLFFEYGCRPFPLI